MKNLRIKNKGVNLYHINNIKTKVMTQNINYNGLMITNEESQTVGNCIDLGFSTENTKSIIEQMRKENISYLGKKALEKFRK